MPLSSRRALLRSLLATAPAIHAQTRSTDVRIKELSTAAEEFACRMPLQAGGVEVRSITLLHVKVTLESRAGKAAEGFGSMPMSNAWSFPSPVLRQDQTLAAMKSLAARIEQITREHPEFGHPMDLNHALQPLWLAAAAELRLPEPMPKLCALITSSPFDAAIADGFGKLLNRSAYAIYGPDVMRHDLSHYLGKEFAGEYLQKYVLNRPQPAMPLYHSVGALDPVAASSSRKRLNDGLPETLPEWINHSGLTHFKIQLNGNDMAGDTGRVVAVDRVITEVQNLRRVADWVYALDGNERCPQGRYVTELLARIREKAPRGFARLQYIEQPTKRDLKADRANGMQEVSQLRPVVADESLTDLESLLLAREMGYTGVALKACLGQSQALLMAAAARKFRMFVCVQDPVCAGASFLHSAGVAAHIPGVVAMEATGRQYIPAANAGWERRFPGLFDIRQGKGNTGLLRGPGLSAV